MGRDRLHILMAQDLLGHLSHVITTNQLVKQLVYIAQAADESEHLISR